MQGQDALLPHVLGWHELYAGPGGGLTDRRGIGSIVLLALLHERFDRFGCDQLHCMAEAGEYARPVMGGATGLQHDCAALLFLEERD